MTTSRTVNRTEAMLAYAAVCEALAIVPELEDIKRLADLTHDLADVMETTRTMRDFAPTTATTSAINRARLLIAQAHLTLTKRAEARAHGGSA